MTEPPTAPASEPPTEPSPDPERDRFQRLEELFHEVSELPADQQLAHLEREAGDDRALVDEVLGLLDYAETAEQRLDGAVGAALEKVAAKTPPPQRIDHYRILRELGSGGLGTVYEAQRDDQFRKRVAIKVVRAGLRSPDLELRFRRERQILASLDHPNIARILDGGTTEDGSPYLVMELVEGEPITAYCRHHRLGTAAKLELFRQVCTAVHYAHQSLVLHRDLKPSNILVSPDGVPKLLDFGIAKVLAEAPRTDSENGDDAESDDERDDERESGRDDGSDNGAAAGGKALPETLAATLTHPGVRPLTPEYASPEQILDRPLTTASDVYSLGILLYEMLVGVRPYQLDGLRASEVERVICEVAPERASAHHRSTLTAERDEARRGSWRGSWRGDRRPWGSDLDNVVAMALRKEPERRYGSAMQLSEDLRRYLGELPVIARPDTLGYRAAKFVRRNRVAVAAATLVALVLVSAVIVTRHQARVAEQERRRAEANLALAEEQRQRAQEVADFMVDIFEISDPSHSRGATVTAREVLDQGARRIAWQLRDRPPLRTTLMTTIGRVYRQLDLLDDAEALLEEAYAERIAAGSESAEGDENGEAWGDERIESARQLGLLRAQQGRFDAAESLLEEAISLVETNEDGAEPLLADLLLDQAYVRHEQGRLPAARTLLERSLDLRRRHFGDGSPQVAEARDRLAQLLYEAASYEQAEALCRQALEDRRRALGSDHPDVALSLNNLAAMRLARGRPAEARPLLEEALALRRRLYGEHHGTIAQTLHNLAMVHAFEGGLDRAETLLEEARVVAVVVYGEDHPQVAETLYNLARLHQQRSDRQAAETLHRQALDIRRRQLGEDHPKIVQSLLGLAALSSEVDAHQAEALYREALELQNRILPEDDYRRTYTLLGLARALLQLDRAVDAEPLYREAWEVRTRALPEGHWETVVASAELGYCLGQLGRTDEARKRIDEALLTLEAERGADDPWVRRVKNWRHDLAVMP